MMEGTIFYKRNLPHIHPPNAMFFVTFRLEGSLPVETVKRLRKEKEAEIRRIETTLPQKDFEKEKYRIEKRFFGKFDKLLDRSTTGPHWLKAEKIAKIIMAKIHEMDGSKFKLIAYCIMSNHVHLLIDMAGFDQASTTNISGSTKDYPLPDALRLLKGSTSRSCNQALKREGKFWHNESYDHYVRDEEERDNIMYYILNNPVKAGFVDDWRNWEFSYCIEM